MPFEIVYSPEAHDDQDVESLLLSISPQFQAILKRSQHRLETEGGLSSADVREKLGLSSTRQ